MAEVALLCTQDATNLPACEAHLAARDPDATETTPALVCGVCPQFGP